MKTPDQIVHYQKEEKMKDLKNWRVFWDSSLKTVTADCPYCRTQNKHEDFRQLVAEGIKSLECQNCCQTAKIDKNEVEEVAELILD